MDMKGWIKAARLHAKLTQQQLGDRMGMSKGNVWAWEKGNHEASLDQLIKIAEITEFREPFPGTAAQANVKSSNEVGAAWPFTSIDEDKVRSLDGDQRAKLERAILHSADAVSVDIKKD